MNPILDLITTDYRGGTAGTLFADAPPSGDPSTSHITKIIVSHNADCVHGLKVFYSWDNGQATKHGSEDGGGSTSSEVNLDPGEFITRIEGRSSSDWIVQLIFVTSRRRCGPYGVSTGDWFEWCGPAPGMRFIAFNGRTDHYLRGLQGKFGKPPNMSHPKSARYESMSLPATATNEASTGEGVSVSHSTFSCHLMSPIATLYVGQERVQFHVHEDTLTKLAFFQAALQGKFKEALEKTIAMPEDDPSKISSLIEFLYTGNYTYTYDPRNVQPKDGSDTPVGDLAEGLYHLGVYVVASKYDSPKLSDMAVANFKAVATELNNINTLRLWKAAYAEDLQLPRAKQDFEQNCCGEGLDSWVKGLFEEHYEEMDETIFTCPQLARDLLRIATIGQ